MVFECNQKMTFECKGLEDRVNDIESSIADFTDLTNGKLDKTAVVQETGAGTEVVMSQKAVTDALGGKLDKTAVVQASGTGTDVVMSQKVVTDELNKKLTKVSAGSDSILYGEGPEGSINVPFKKTATADTIAQRTAGGQLKAADGVEEDDLATVKQLNVIANKGLDTLTNVNLTVGNTTVQYDPTGGIELNSTARFTDGAGNHDAAMELDLPIVGINGIAIGKAVDSEKVEVGLDDTQKIQYVELAEGQSLTSEQLDVLRLNKNNQIVYTLTDGLTSYYFRLAVDLHNGEWLYESCNDSTVTLRVNLVRGNVTFTKVGGGLDTIKKGTGEFSEIFNYDAAHANTASGNYSHAEGYSTQAGGVTSHAEGANTLANGFQAHAEGYSTQSYGNAAHAEGEFTLADEEASHAEGEHTSAKAKGSHVEGLYTRTTEWYSHAEGKYNINPMPKGLLHVIGVGVSSSDRRDGFEVYNTGEVWCKGPLYVGGNGYTLDKTTSKEVATQEYVNNAIASSPSTTQTKYQHNLVLEGTQLNSTFKAFMSIPRSDNTQITTFDELVSILGNAYIPCTGYIYNGSQKSNVIIAFNTAGPGFYYNDPETGGQIFTVGSDVTVTDDPKEF